jgi:hypothetical protein
MGDEDIDVNAVMAEYAAEQKAAEEALKIDEAKDEATEEADTTQSADETVEKSSEDELSESEKLLESIAAAGEEVETQETDSKSDTLPANVQKKIDREVAQRKQLQEQVAQYQSKIEQMAASMQPKQDMQEEFEVPQTMAEFKQLIAKTLAEESSAVELQKKRAAEIAEEKAFAESVIQIDEVGAKLFEDYDEKITPAVNAGRITPAMIREIARLEPKSGAKAAYYLSSNPDLAKSIAQMPVIDQIREVAAINARLSVKAQTKKVSSAPKPTESKGGTTVGLNKSTGKAGENESMTQFNERMFREYGLPL